MASQRLTEGHCRKLPVWPNSRIDEMLPLRRIQRLSYKARGGGWMFTPAYGSTSTLHFAFCYEMELAEQIARPATENRGQPLRLEKRVEVEVREGWAY